MNNPGASFTGGDKLSGWLESNFTAASYQHHASVNVQSTQHSGRLDPLCTTDLSLVWVNLAVLIHIADCKQMMSRHAISEGFTRVYKRMWDQHKHCKF